MLHTQVASIDQLAMHFELDSNLLHCESDEAQRQLAREEGEGESRDLSTLSQLIHI